MCLLHLSEILANPFSSMPLSDAATPDPNESFALFTDRSKFTKALLTHGIKVHIHFELRYASCCNHASSIPICSLGRYINALPACEYAWDIEPDQIVDPYVMTDLLCPRCRTQPLVEFGDRDYPHSKVAQLKWAWKNNRYGSDPFTSKCITLETANDAVADRFAKIAESIAMNEVVDVDAGKYLRWRFRYEEHKEEVDRVCRERVERDDVAPDDYTVMPWEIRFPHKSER